MTWWDSFVNFLSDIWTYMCTNVDAIAFLIVAAIAVLAALYVVSSDEIMHSMFYLALVFVCVAVTYFFLEAEFIGVVQLLVYVGAITILFAFSIMLTSRTPANKEGDKHE
jgi:NADH:ubiquinone oxidoreductase subunit 6 (subunit J)